MSLGNRSAGPPALSPFGLRLHHDGRFTHKGAPIANLRLRAHFDRSVEYVSEESKYIVRLKHFRGEVEIEEAGFFVRSIDLSTGEIVLSDGTLENLDVSTMTPSPIDGALLCRVKRDCAEGGLLARFCHSAQADFSQAIEADGEGHVVVVAGQRALCPDF